MTTGKETEEYETLEMNELVSEELLFLENMQVCPDLLPIDLSEQLAK